MQLVTSRAKIEHNDFSDSARATIKANPALFNSLSRDLYPDAPRAVLREILINAIDAHNESKVRRPVEITLPTAWSEVFSIRDFGKGLTREEFYTIYMDYGESTRSGNNENHGGFGVGSKSPFAYTDNFTIISYNGGVASTYLLYYDDEGYPTRTFVKAEATAETGLEVRFTTKNLRDYTLFQRAAKQILPHIPPHLYKFVDGEVPVSYLEYDKYGSILRIPTGFVPGQPTLGIKMGYYLYEVDISLFKEHVKASSSAVYLNGHTIEATELVELFFHFFKHAVFELPIGALQVHLAREVILVTKSTSNLLLTYLVESIKEMRREANDHLDVIRDTFLVALNDRLKNNGLIPIEVEGQAPFDESMTFYDVRGVLEFNSPVLISKAGFSRFDRSRILKGYGDLLNYLNSLRTDYSYTRTYDAALYSHATLLVRSCEVSSEFMTELNTKNKVKTEWIPEDNEPSSYSNTTRVIIPFVLGRAEKEVFTALSKLKEHISPIAPESIEQQYNYNSYSYTPRLRTPPTRSLQDPSHNLLIFSFEKAGKLLGEYTQEARNYLYGSKKEDWSSGAYNVETLKELAAGRPVFLVPTRMGVHTDQDFHRSMRILSHLRNIIPRSWNPLVVGLPASKGTKKIESAFPGKEDLLAYIDKLLTSNFVRRRLTFVNHASKLDVFTWLRPQSVSAAAYWGPVELLIRYARLCRRYYRALTDTKHPDLNLVLSGHEDLTGKELPKHDVAIWEVPQLALPTLTTKTKNYRGWIATTRSDSDIDESASIKDVAKALASHYKTPPTGARWKAAVRNGNLYHIDLFSHDRISVDPNS